MMISLLVRAVTLHSRMYVGECRSTMFCHAKAHTQPVESVSCSMKHGDGAHLHTARQCTLPKRRHEECRYDSAEIHQRCNKANS